MVGVFRERRDQQTKKNGGKIKRKVIRSVGTSTDTKESLLSSPSLQSLCIIPSPYKANDFKVTKKMQQ